MAIPGDPWRGVVCIHGRHELESTGIKVQLECQHQHVSGSPWSLDILCSRLVFSENAARQTLDAKNMKYRCGHITVFLHDNNSEAKNSSSAMNNEMDAKKIMFVRELGPIAPITVMDDDYPWPVELRRAVLYLTTYKDFCERFGKKVEEATAVKLLHHMCLSGSGPPVNFSTAQVDDILGLIPSNLIVAFVLLHTASESPTIPPQELGGWRPAEGTLSPPVRIADTDMDRIMSPPAGQQIVDKSRFLINAYGKVEPPGGLAVESCANVPQQQSPLPTVSQHPENLVRGQQPVAVLPRAVFDPPAEPASNLIQVKSGNSVSSQQDKNSPRSDCNSNSSPEASAKVPRPNSSASNPVLSTPVQAGMPEPTLQVPEALPSPSPATVPVRPEAPLLGSAKEKHSVPDVSACAPLQDEAARPIPFEPSLPPHPSVPITATIPQASDHPTPPHSIPLQGPPPLPPGMPPPAALTTGTAQPPLGTPLPFVWSVSPSAVTLPPTPSGPPPLLPTPLPTPAPVPGPAPPPGPPPQLASALPSRPPPHHGSALPGAAPQLAPALPPGPPPQLGSALPPGGPPQVGPACAPGPLYWPSPQQHHPGWGSGYSPPAIPPTPQGPRQAPLLPVGGIYHSQSPSVVRPFGSSPGHIMGGWNAPGHQGQNNQPSVMGGMASPAMTPGRQLCSENSLFLSGSPSDMPRLRDFLEKKVLAGMDFFPESEGMIRQMVVDLAGLRVQVELGSQLAAVIMKAKYFTDPRFFQLDGRNDKIAVYNDSIAFPFVGPARQLCEAARKLVPSRTFLVARVPTDVVDTRRTLLGIFKAPRRHDVLLGKMESSEGSSCPVVRILHCAGVSFAFVVLNSEQAADAFMYNLSRRPSPVILGSGVEPLLFCRGSSGVPLAHEPLADSVEDCRKTLAASTVYAESPATEGKKQAFVLKKAGGLGRSICVEGFTPSGRTAAPMFPCIFSVSGDPHSGEVKKPDQSPYGRDMTAEDFPWMAETENSRKTQVIDTEVKNGELPSLVKLDNHFIRVVADGTLEGGLMEHLTPDFLQGAGLVDNVCGVEKIPTRLTGKKPNVVFLQFENEASRDLAVEPRPEPLCLKTVKLSLSKYFLRVRSNSTTAPPGKDKLAVEADFQRPKPNVPVVRRTELSRLSSTTRAGQRSLQQPVVGGSQSQVQLSATAVKLNRVPQIRPRKLGENKGSATPVQGSQVEVASAAEGLARSQERKVGIELGEVGALNVRGRLNLGKGQPTIKLTGGARAKVGEGVAVGEGKGTIVGPGAHNPGVGRGDGEGGVLAKTEEKVQTNRETADETTKSEIPRTGKAIDFHGHTTRLDTGEDVKENVASMEVGRQSEGIESSQKAEAVAELVEVVVKEEQRNGEMEEDVKGRGGGITGLKEQVSEDQTLGTREVDLDTSVEGLAPLPTRGHVSDGAGSAEEKVEEPAVGEAEVSGEALKGVQNMGVGITHQSLIARSVRHASSEDPSPVPSPRMTMTVTPDRRNLETDASGPVEAERVATVSNAVNGESTLMVDNNLGQSRQGGDRRTTEGLSRPELVGSTVEVATATAADKFVERSASMLTDIPASAEGDRCTPVKSTAAAKPDHKAAVAMDSAVKVGSSSGTKSGKKAKLTATGPLAGMRAAAAAAAPKQLSSLEAEKASGEPNPPEVKLVKGTAPTQANIILKPPGISEGTTPITSETFVELSDAGKSATPPSSIAREIPDVRLGTARAAPEATVGLDGFRLPGPAAGWEQPRPLTPLPGMQNGPPQPFLLRGMPMQVFPQTPVGWQPRQMPPPFVGMQGPHQMMSMRRPSGMGPWQVPMGDPPLWQRPFVQGFRGPGGFGGGLRPDAPYLHPARPDMMPLYEQGRGAGGDNEQWENEWQLDDDGRGAISEDPRLRFVRSGSGAWNTASGDNPSPYARSASMEHSRSAQADRPSTEEEEWKRDAVWALEDFPGRSSVRLDRKRSAVENGDDSFENSPSTARESQRSITEKASQAFEESWRRSDSNDSPEVSARLHRGEGRDGGERTVLSEDHAGRPKNKRVSQLEEKERTVGRRSVDRVGDEGVHLRSEREAKESRQDLDRHGRGRKEGERLPADRRDREDEGRKRKLDGKVGADSELKRDSRGVIRKSSTVEDRDDEDRGRKRRRVNDDGRNTPRHRDRHVESGERGRSDKWYKHRDHDLEGDREFRKRREDLPYEQTFSRKVRDDVEEARARERRKRERDCSEEKTAHRHEKGGPVSRYKRSDSRCERDGSADAGKGHSVVSREKKVEAREASLVQQIKVDPKCTGEVHPGERLPKEDCVVAPAMIDDLPNEQGKATLEMQEEGLKRRKEPIVNHEVEHLDLPLEGSEGMRAQHAGGEGTGNIDMSVHDQVGVSLEQGTGSDSENEDVEVLLASAPSSPEELPRETCGSEEAASGSANEEDVTEAAVPEGRSGEEEDDSLKERDAEKRGFDFDLNETPEDWL